jgi:hypothetical protein
VLSPATNGPEERSKKVDRMLPSEKIPKRIHCNVSEDLTDTQLEGTLVATLSLADRAVELDETTLLNKGPSSQ